MEFHLINITSFTTTKIYHFFDRSIKGLYPPGSTIKPMVALAGLELGNITIKDQIFCPGFYKLADYSRKFND